MAAKRRVSIVAHTHWDREWYEPFAAFRHRLLALVDGLLERLETEPGFTHFLLDGQTQIVDDYLALRPEAEARVRALTAAGRLALGPWRVLPDEWCVSGETLLRNLEHGLARAEALGGLMTVGYLPDMFGHVAQMPQLLRLAGIDDAVVWRGVPRAITTTGFTWIAPDGSRVRAEYLFGSYANAAAIPPSVDGLLALVEACAAEVGEGLVGALLLMHDRDHSSPAPWLPTVVAAAAHDARDAPWDVTITSLAAHGRAQPREGLPEWHGELRSGARANVLTGVTSNRVDVHQRCATAERWVERIAEPLAALLLPDSRAARDALGLAWDDLVLNSAHDSAGACSHDDTVTGVLARYAEAEHLARAVTRDALAAAIESSSADAFVVVNPTARARSGCVELTRVGRGPARVVSADGAPLAVQLVGTDERTTTTVVQGPKVHWLITLLRETAAHGHGVAEVGLDPPRVRMAAPGDATVDIEPFLAALHAAGARGVTQAVEVTEAPVQTLAVAVPGVPGFGWTTVRVGGPPTPMTPTTPITAVARVAADEHTLTNDELTVTIDRATATYSIERRHLRVGGLGRLVDGGDAGDTYNYSPPAGDRLVDHPRAVRTRVVEAGPVRAKVEIVAGYDWPAALVDDAAARADGTVAISITTTLELRAGEPFLRVEHRFDNHARDHRLRAHFPLPHTVAGSDAECAFAVVHRGLAAEGGPQEHGLPTFTSRRFVDCSGVDRADATAGLALVHDGLLEYEVVADGREVALTLLRATGWLSRPTTAYRVEPAGPPIAVPQAQLLGERVARYAVLLHDGDWRGAKLHARADEALVPLFVAPGVRTPAEGQWLTVDGAEVSAVRRDGEGHLTVRTFNAGDNATDVHVAPGAGWAGPTSRRLAPWQIATVTITAADEPT